MTYQTPYDDREEQKRDYSNPKERYGLKIIWLRHANFDPITNQDNLILDIQLQRANKAKKLQSLSNHASYKDIHQKADLPKLSNNIHKFHPEGNNRQGGSSKSKFSIPNFGLEFILKI